MSTDSGLRDAFGAVQDVDEGKRAVLVDIPWEVIDSFRSDFHRACFDEYLSSRLPVMCWQHRKEEPIGRAIEWQKGQRANQFVARFSDFDAVPRARQAFAQIRDGDLTDFSFYYDQAVAVAHPNTRGAVRFMKARMPEISPVTVGSIPGAKATGFRANYDGLVFDEYVLEPDELAALNQESEWAALDRRAEITLARLTLGGFHRRATAGVRAAIELAERDAEVEHRAAQERARVSRQLAVMDATAPDPHFNEEYFGTSESWSVNPDAAMPDYPPQDMLRAVVDSGEMTEMEAIAAWRSRYGKTDAKRDPNEPNARGVRPFPPQDLIDAQTANGVHPMETIRAWRVNYGFEEIG